MHYQRAIREVACIGSQAGDCGYFIVSLILAVFIPSKKELFVIYGVGKSVEWVKSNDKLQKMPEKLIDALDAVIESYKENE